MSDFDAQLFSDKQGVLSNTRVEPRLLPQVPQITLWLLGDDFPRSSVSEEEYLQAMASPPYWAFCWGGGQALAKYLYEHPDLVENKRVVDFGAGSGVVSIAAMLQGGSAALAVDCDPKALVAVENNAKLNNVRVATTGEMPSLDKLSAGWDMIFAADICYEELGLDWLASYVNDSVVLGGPELVLADSRYSDLQETMPGLKKVARYRVRTFPDLDEAEQFDWVTIYRTVK